MPRLRLLQGHYQGSHPETGVRWLAGEEREVSDETAAYLLDAFVERFVEVVIESEAPAESEAEVVSAPDHDRAMRSPRRRG